MSLLTHALTHSCACPTACAARAQVDTTREDANEAGDHLQSLKRKHSIQIGLLYFIIFGLVVGIVGSLIKRFA